MEPERHAKRMAEPTRGDDGASCRSAPSTAFELGYAEVLMAPESAQSETHSEDGVDLTLIRWLLSLTPAERLDVLQRTVSSILSIRENQDEN